MLASVNVTNLISNVAGISAVLVIAMPFITKRISKYLSSGFESLLDQKVMPILRQHSTDINALKVLTARLDGAYQERVLVNQEKHDAESRAPDPNR